MSIVVPVTESHDNCSECVDYIFENSEYFPDGFYMNIMDLLKKYHDYGNNLDDIHKLLEENKKVLDETVYNKIKTYLNNENVINIRESDNTSHYLVLRFFVSTGLIFLILIAGSSIILNE
jgi:hypothetical protein